MKHLLFSSLLLLLFSCNSDTASSKSTAIDTDSTTVAPAPAPVKEQLTTASFILDGHEILAEKKLDFNSDGFEDVVLVLKNKQEEEISDYANDNPSPRPLLFLAGDEQGSLQLVARNDNAVYCIDCGGQMEDPFNGIAINKHFVSFEYYGGSQLRWSRVTTFYYNKEKKAWFLYEDGTETFEAANPATTAKANQQTKLIPFESFDIYQPVAK
ncbi:hypothetical protein [Aureispira anguillae]|uniref:Uncharacterized protein n=1 Tax=Aureispira anguillae TaxID=2864201 RepID=A0A915YHI4_9BACT|nr:hypothetical protein [Aureispira anguillae]BDS13273.1 hypothetical protein AsAng_0040030 [Aureispira anguillae]